MPQEFCVVQCAGCHAFQVQQVKKKKEFTCPVCHKKQSVLKCFAISHSAKDCRLYVTQLNEARGAAEAQEPVERPALQPWQQPEAAAAAPHSAAWEQFVGSDEDEALEQLQQHEEQEAGFVTHVPDAVKGSKHGRGSQASVGTDRQQRGGKKRGHVASAEGVGVPEADVRSSKSRRTESAHVLTQQQGWQRQPVQQPHMQQPMQRPLNVAHVDISAGVGAQQTVPKAAQQQQWPAQWQGQTGRAPLCPPAGRITAMAGSSQQQQGGMQRQWSGHSAANMPMHVPTPQQQQQQQQQQQWPQSYGQGHQQQRPPLAADQKVQHQRPSQQHQHQQPQLQQQATALGSSGAWSAFMTNNSDDCDGFGSEDDLEQGLPSAAAQQLPNWGARHDIASRHGMVIVAGGAGLIAAKGTCNQAASRWGAVVDQQQGREGGGGIEFVLAFDSL